MQVSVQKKNDRLSRVVEPRRAHEQAEDAAPKRSVARGNRRRTLPVAHADDQLALRDGLAVEQRYAALPVDDWKRRKAAGGSVSVLREKGGRERERRNEQRCGDDDERAGKANHGERIVALGGAGGGKRLFAPRAQGVARLISVRRAEL